MNMGYLSVYFELYFLLWSFQWVAFAHFLIYSQICSTFYSIMNKIILLILILDF